MNSFISGRSDFVSDIDNEALDFEQLEAFIHNNASVVQSPPPPPPQRHQQQQQQTSTANNEQHLINNNQSNLPESPPDSGSEPPYSPNNVLHKISNLNRNIQLGISDLNDHQANNQNLTMEHLTQQQNLSLNTLTELHVPHHHLLTKLDTSGTLPAIQDIQQSLTGNSSSNINDNLQMINDNFTRNALSTQTSQSVHDVTSNQHLAATSSSLLNTNSTNNSSTTDASQIQCIKFGVFQQHQWHTLLDHNHQELIIPHFRVDADKGFNFSNSDDAFVCQKKNHFQITCHVQLHGNGVFVKTPTGFEKVRTFHLHFYGAKLEAPTQTIRIEQSQSDRSKKPFYPVLVDLQNNQVGKVTVGRLHFSETTCNNMRKKGRPNPEQRYFQLVVGLHAHTYSGYFPIISHASERIIVRASNPGQFEGDVDMCCWQRGITQNSIYHQGRIGINTDMPDESLVINGNLKLSGHIIQPSDRRVKNNIEELNTMKQLENINQMRIVRYQYDANFAANNELDYKHFETGIIAQEIQKILPDAVHNGGNVRITNGTHIDNFLQVNKDRIFMENIGAVKQLSKITDNLEKRIENLENHQNVRYQFIDKVKVLQFFMILMLFLTALWF
ncbi:unnamed protein product [Diamesa tonsa]